MKKILEMGILTGAMSMARCSDAESKVSQIWYIFGLYYNSIGLGFIKCAKEFWHAIPGIALIYTRGDQKVRGKVLLNRIALIDCNENS